MNADSADAMEAIYQPSFCLDVYANLMADWNMCFITMLSISITKIIRDNSFDLTVYTAAGTTYVNQATIIVDWIWIIPAGLFWPVSLTMLIGTAWKTHHSGVWAWRGSSWALVFLGFNSKGMETVGDYLWSEKDLENKAKEVQVRLHITDEQAELVHV